MLARKTTADQAAEIQWISRQQVKHAQKELHPNHAAQQVPGCDQRQGKERNICACSQNRRSQNQCRRPVCQRSSQRNGKLSAPLVGNLLAFRIGVGKEPANRQQKNCAYA